MIAGSAGPFPRLLSQAWVAFIIETDNEFERLMPHHTNTAGPAAGARRGVWLGSSVMWWNCMRFVGETGVPVRELQRLAGIATNLHGMQRWGYITVTPDASGGRIHATAQGKRAREVWAPLPALIESRWGGRFGAGDVQFLRQALLSLLRKIPFRLPDCLPILKYGLFTRVAALERTAQEPDPGLPLPALLARALTGFALDYERDSPVSLAVGANLLRLLGETPVRVADLPSQSGVSREALAMALGYLQKRGAIAMGRDGRARLVRLTPDGMEAKSAWQKRLTLLIRRWRERFGADTIGELQQALSQIASRLTLPKPYPDGWRAAVRPPKTLPYFPMVLHRGGFPDGS